MILIHRALTLSSRSSSHSFSGNVSKSFGATDGSVTGTEAGGGTLYRHAVFGFSYLWRPLYDVSYGRFDASLGRLLVTFAHELRMKMFQKVQTSGLQGAESLQLNLYSDVHSYARNSSDSSARDKDSSQWRVHQGAAMQRSKDDGRRVDAASLSDHILRALTPANAGATMSVIDFGSTPLDTLPKQAAAASKLSLLVGTEGAGFSQQLFMPPRSVLVIIHCPRPRRKNGGKSFLDAVVVSTAQVTMSQNHYQATVLYCTSKYALTSPFPQCFLTLVFPFFIPVATLAWCRSSVPRSQRAEYPATHLR